MKGRRERNIRLLKRSACLAGFGLLLGLAGFGAWSIHEKLTDPRRLARAAVDDGSAMRTLEGSLASERLCATVLDGPEPFAMYGTSESLPSVRALAASGLIEPLPPGEAPTERPYPFYRMSEAAGPFMQTEPFGDRRLVKLCYGRPAPGWVYLEGDGTLDPAPILRFTYTVADRPAWADRADIRAAFPFLNDITAGPVHASARIRFDGAAPDLSHLEIVPELDAPAAIRGFGFCPPEGYPRPDGCRTD
ncbi:hypothetical protein [Aureimonas sp. ME7]|uniref:hypothetical protein n=1 Tax=Aureimonas sp. ME7 TaxID=2744252 RepID=UPI0015F4C204|nr:hypothetical protein [Aureimonas sp. ME7]